MIRRQQWVDHKFNLGIDVGWKNNILNRIEDTEIRLCHYIKNLSNKQLSQKTNGMWSIKEHVGHLTDLESLWLNRFEQFEKLFPELVAADMTNKKTELSNHNEQHIDKLIEDFRLERQKLIYTVNQLSEKSQKHRALHPRIKTMMKPVDLLFFIAEHDDHHLTSIKKIIKNFCIKNPLNDIGSKDVSMPPIGADIPKNKQRIIAGFENRTLPKSKWTHEAHLIVSLWHCINYNHEETIYLLRTKIKLYNETVGTPNTEIEGYHETLTRFWVWQTNQFLQESESKDFDQICSSFILSNRSSKEAPLQYYSKEILFSNKARTEWVKPDLKDLEAKNNRYLIIEKYFPDKVKELYARFDKNGRMLPKGVKYIDSWINEDVNTCYQLMESESIEKLKVWIKYWNDLADFKIIPVIKSKEAKQKVLLR